jgi:hypothetical protein
LLLIFLFSIIIANSIDENLYQLSRLDGEWSSTVIASADYRGVVQLIGGSLLGTHHLFGLDKSRIIHSYQLFGIPYLGGGWSHWDISTPFPPPCRCIATNTPLDELKVTYFSIEDSINVLGTKLGERRGGEAVNALISAR